MAKKNNTAVSDEEIIAALLESGTIREAAQKTGLTDRTIRERMCSRELKSAYKGAKTDIIRKAVLSINGKLSTAIDAVADIMNDKATNAAVRLQAAQTIINNAAKFTERLTAEEQDTDASTRDPLDWNIF